MRIIVYLIYDDYLIAFAMYAASFAENSPFLRLLALQIAIKGTTAYHHRKMSCSFNYFYCNFLPREKICPSAGSKICALLSQELHSLSIVGAGWELRELDTIKNTLRRPDDCRQRRQALRQRV